MFRFRGELFISQKKYELVGRVYCSWLVIMLVVRAAPPAVVKIVVSPKPRQSLLEFQVQGEEHSGRNLKMRERLVLLLEGHRFDWQ